MKFQILTLTTLILLGFAVPNSLQAYPLKKIRNNSLNKLKLKVDLEADFAEICASFQAMSKEKILSKLKEKKLGWHEASYGLYFLAGKYLREDNFNEAVAIYKDAAEHYMNPMAQVKIAKLHYYKKEKLAQHIGGLEDYKMDRGLSYININLALESTRQFMEIQENKVGIKYILDLVVANGLGLLDNFNVSSVKNSFNFDEAQEQLKKAIEEMKEKMKKIYT